MKRVLCLFLGLALALPACRSKHEPSSGDDPSGAKPSNADLPPLELRDDTPGLLLTWIDEKGDFHVAQQIDKVPENARGEVRVVVSSKEEGTGKLVYVADLGKKNPDGTYLIKVMSRAEWDEKGASRRKARLEALAPPPSASAPAGASASAGPGGQDVPNGKVVAIIYGAEWCRPCHDAARYLKQRGVQVIQKDIDEDDGARAEMKQKLDRAHLGGASIPVIDIGGHVLVGFSPLALDRAVEAAQNSKSL